MNWQLIANFCLPLAVSIAGYYSVKIQLKARNDALFDKRYEFFLKIKKIDLYMQINNSDDPSFYQYLFRIQKMRFPDEKEVDRFLNVNGYNIISYEARFLFGFDIELFVTDLCCKNFEDEEIAKKSDETLDIDSFISHPDKYEVFNKYLILDANKNWFEENLPTYYQWNNCILEVLKTPHYILWFKWKYGKQIAKSKE